jgi:hypothetical protein
VYIAKVDNLAYESEFLVTKKEEEEEEEEEEKKKKKSIAPHQAVNITSKYALYYYCRVEICQYSFSKA